jgi:ketosteroid isomerase-like protein
MSQRNIQLAEATLKAWRDGSLADSDLLDPAVEWVNPPDAIERGTRTGIEAFVAAGEAVQAAFEDARVDLDRLIEDGDRVVGIGTLRGHGQESGVEIERRMSLIWTIANRRILRFEWFLDPGGAEPGHGP